MHIIEVVDSFDAIAFLAVWSELTGSYPFDSSATFNGVRS